MPICMYKAHNDSVFHRVCLFCISTLTFKPTHCALLRIDHPSRIK